MTKKEFILANGWQEYYKGNYILTEWVRNGKPYEWMGKPLNEAYRWAKVEERRSKLPSYKEIYK